MKVAFEKITTEQLEYVVMLNAAYLPINDTVSEKLRINRVRQIAQNNSLPYSCLPKKLHRLQTFQRAHRCCALFIAIHNSRKRPRSKLDRARTRCAPRLLRRCEHTTHPP